MTKEEEKAIEIVAKYLNFNEICGTRNFKEALETVLNMLKEKDNIINEQLKENVELRKELNEENKRCMILANNDKFKEQVIDLMALAIINYDDQLVINRYKNINEVKQCFEREVRE